MALLKFRPIFELCLFFFVELTRLESVVKSATKAPPSEETRINTIVAVSVNTINILSLNAEVGIPTGNEDNGLGKGVWVFEPSVSFGQLLPADTFVHLQAGVELPSDRDKAEDEIFWAMAFGRGFTANTWGRSWTPMVELIGRRENDTTEWNVVPQVQVSLNTRQHILANVGVLLPVDDDAHRQTQVFFYILWEWFDGGLLDGW